jgi:hypothetical protein
MVPRLSVGSVVWAVALGLGVPAAQASHWPPDSRRPADQPPPSEPGGTMSFVPPDKGTLELEADGDRAKAVLSVNVRNDSDYSGPLQVRLRLSDASGSEAIAGAEGKGDFRIAGEGAPLEIDAHDARAFRLVLSGPASLPEGLDGVLVIRPARGDGVVAPAALAVRATLPAASSRFAKARVEPGTVTVVASCRPAIFRGECGGEAKLDVRDVAAGAAIDGKQSLGQTELGASERPRRAPLTLRVPDGIEAGATDSVAAVAKVHDVDFSGTYEGTLPLDPQSNTAPSLSVKVLSRDDWWWPLGAIFFGALAGWLLLRYNQELRPKDRLKDRLTSTAADYIAAEKGVSAKGWPQPYTLAATFRENSDWRCPPRSAEAREAERLYCEIEGADSQETLDGRRETVLDLIDHVAGWKQVCHSAHLTKGAMDALPWEDAPIVGATESLLAPTADRPADDPDRPEVPATAAQATAYRHRLDDQTLALREWLACWQLHQHALEVRERIRPAGLSDAEQERLRDLNPDALAEAYLLPVRSKRDLEEARALDRFRELVRSLTALERASAPSEPAAAADATAGPPLALALPVPVDTSALVAAALREQTRRADVVVFLVTFAVTALAYLATIYPGTTFGSPWDYIGAFAAGVIGQAAVNAALLPWNRRMEPAPAAAPAA